MTYPRPSRFRFINRAAATVAVLVIITAIVAIGGCRKCDETTPRVSDAAGWTYYDFTNDYSLELASVEEIVRNDRRQLVVTPAADQRGDYFAADGFEVFVSVPGYGFWIDVINQSDDDLTIDWSRTQYVDESGKPHDVFQQRRGPLPPPFQMKVGVPKTLRPSESSRNTVVPIFKSYVVAIECDQYTDFNEPLVPADARLPSKSAVKERVRVLGERETPVRLLVPVTRPSGDQLAYSMVFVLRPFAKEPKAISQVQP